MKETCKRKLHSAKGASMIIAMVFMLICVFVGGSVLAAATMNSYRIEHLKDQQNFLSQRSAANLVSDALSATPMNMTIYDKTQVTRPIKIHANGMIEPTGPKEKERVLHFSIPMGSNPNAFQRTVYEAAVLNYLKVNDVDFTSGRVIVELENFKYKNGPDVETLTFTSPTTNSFWLPMPNEKADQNGKMKVNVEVPKTKDSTTDMDVDEFEAHFVFDKDTYDYAVTFDNAVPFGKDIQMRVSMLAAGPESVTEIPRITEIIPDEASPAAGAVPVRFDITGKEVTTSSEMMTISWMVPRIEKGNVNG